MRLFNPETKFMQFLANLTDLILLGLLWCLFAVTIVGIGPATAALYYAVTKAVRRDRGTSPYREFFRAIKESWKTALVLELFLILLAVGTLMLDGYVLLGAIINHTIEEPIRFVFGILEVFFLLSIAVYAFPLVSRFEMRSWNLLILSISLVFRYFGRTLLMVILLTVTVLFLCGLPEFIFITPGIFVLFLSYPMEKILGSYLRVSGYEASADEDAWYLE